MRERSPNYPAISFPSALQLAGRIYHSERRNPVPRPAAMQLMGFGSVTGAAQASLSALKKYGLLVDHGGSVRISDETHRLLAYPEGNPERVRLERELAMRPPLFREILREYPNGLPADESLRGHLIAEHGFTELAAGILVKVLGETFRRAEASGQARARDVPPAPRDQTERHLQPEVGEGPDARGSRVAHAKPPPPLVWSVGNGITVEVRSNQPLEARHYRLLAKYVVLAAEAAELEETGTDASAQ